MRCSFAALIAIGLIFILPVFIAPVFGICVAQKNCSVSSDSGQDTILNRSGTYDPCDSWLTWTESFYRTNQIGGMYLNIRYAGTSLPRHSYYSYDLTRNQTHTFYNTEYVGASTSHEIIISKSSLSSGFFTTISATAVYSAGGGQSPPGD
jgi:hypothetical protein